jgi:hypothetical protein
VIGVTQRKSASNYGDSKRSPDERSDIRGAIPAYRCAHAAPAKPQRDKPHHTNLRVTTQSTHVHGSVSGKELIGTKVMKSFRFVTPALATTLGIDGFTCFAGRFASLSVAATVLVGICLTPSSSFACQARINLAAIEQELAKPSLNADLRREASAIKNKAASAVQAGRREEGRHLYLELMALLGVPASAGRFRC